MRFTKMHGLGNDYLYFYGEVPENVVDLAVRYSERHTGVGSDGLIFIGHSDKADFTMRIFNADGSEAMMCGNGIRCVGKYVYDKGYTDKTRLTVETRSGIKTLELHVRGGKVYKVTVGMGKACASPEQSVQLKESGIRGIPVSVGNPHFVIPVEDPDTIDVAGIGSAIEHHEDFPGGVNVEFIRVTDANRLRMRVWERGSGITMACGTGACASAMAAVSLGLCRRDSDIEVCLDGGSLFIRIQKDDSVVMTGPAETVCEGEIEVC